MTHSARLWDSIGQLSLNTLFLKRRKNPLHSGFRRQMFCGATFCSIVGFDRPAVFEQPLLEKKKNHLPVDSRDKCFAMPRSGRLCSSIGCLQVNRLSLKRRKNPLPSRFRRQMFCGATFWSIVGLDRPAVFEHSLLEKKKKSPSQ